MGSVSAANPAGGAAGGPCKISADPSGQYDFQMREADMPVTIKLCENHQGDPATTSKFNTRGGIQIYSALDSTAPAISGQPSSAAATSFSMSLKVGVYNVVMGVDPLPESVYAYVYEGCSSPSNPLAIIPTTLQQPSGYFTLRVV